VPLLALCAKTTAAAAECWGSVTSIKLPTMMTRTTTTRFSRGLW